LKPHLSDKWYLFCLLIHLIVGYYFYGHIGDDSFIFFRYVDNFMQGNGLRWNVDGIPVEGFSSPLWTIILILLSPFFDIVFSAQLFGTLFMIGASWRVWQLAKICNGFPLTATIGSSLGLGIHYWASGGLETGLYVFVFLSTILSLHKKASIWWLGLLGVCRPEGIFLLPLVYGMYIFQFGFQKKTMSLFLPLICWLFIRWFYYDDILPNTYYAKASGHIFDRITEGLIYVQWIIPSLLIGILFDRQKIRFWILPIGLTLIIVVGGGDWMWHGRLLIPIYMALWALGTSLHRVLSVLCCLPLCFYWIPVPVLEKLPLGEKLPMHSYQEGSLIQVNKEIAVQIKQNIPKGSLIAVNHAGALPYYLPEYSFVDMTGLNDRHIARKEGGLHQKFDSAYILKRQPDLIVLNSFTDPSIKGFVSDYWIGETDLYGTVDFKEQYVPIAQCWDRIRSGGGKAFICLFKRRS
jgi:arabinofuranosyltransferase